MSRGELERTELRHLPENELRRINWALGYTWRIEINLNANDSTQFMIEMRGRFMCAVSTGCTVAQLLEVCDAMHRTGRVPDSTPTTMRHVHNPASNN